MSGAYNKDKTSEDTESVTDIDNISSSLTNEELLSIYSESILTPSESYSDKKYKKQKNSYTVNMGGGDEKQTPQNKITSFIEKDVFILNNYETAPFISAEHAAEVLSPYHIFDTLADTIKFKGSRNQENYFNVEKIEAIKNFILGRSFDKDNGFIAELLMFHEQRFFTQKFLGEVSYDPVPVEKKPSSRPPRTKKKKYVPKAVKKKASKNGFILKFRRSVTHFVYGDPYCMHFRLPDYN